ncbi:MAG: substrate-binding domain-containing protein [Bifidobacteriaceae bacterium]|jgi:ribose transport system substrate-binding protein|nr:substrate-binding domain-containing protein [Bifidobacteriaceae bacterium]
MAPKTNSVRIGVLAGAAAVLLATGACAGVEDENTGGTASKSPSQTQPSAEAGLSLEGKTIGVAVVGTQHFWDQEAFEGAVSEVERLGGKVITTDAARDQTVHAENHDTFLTAGVDAVITILGDEAVEPKLKALTEAGIPVFGVDHASEYVVNNAQSDSVIGGEQAGQIAVDYLKENGKENAKVAVFNAFSESLTYCGDRYNNWKKVLTEQLPGVEILTPELAEQFSNPAEDARQQTLNFLESHPEGTIDLIHVACWDQPAIGVVQAIEESGRTDVVVTAFDAGPDTLTIQAEEGSPFVGNVAQQPRQIGTIAAQNVARHFAGETVEKDSFVETFPAAGVTGAKEVYKQLGYGDLG